MFNVGQKIVAIKDHSQNIFKKGDVFTVLAVSETPCCKRKILDIGIKGTSVFGKCGMCGKEHFKLHSIWWVASQSFVPIVDDFQSISLTKILEHETPFVSAN